MAPSIGPGSAAVGGFVLPTFYKMFKKSGKGDNMKCQFCNKNIDEVDIKCSMCTICGWAIDAVLSNPSENKDERPTAAPPSGSEKK